MIDLVRARGGAATALAIVLAVCSSARAEEPGASGFDCVMEPAAMARLAATSEGLLERIDVDRGDRVSRGQVVAVLESSVERSTLELARAKAAMRSAVAVATAKAELGRKNAQRSRELAGKDTLSTSKLDEAETTLRQLEAELGQAREEQRLDELELARAEAAYERRVIRSPIDGIVMRRLRAPGEYTEPIEVLEVAQTNPLRVDVLVPAEQFGRVRVGDVVQIDAAAPVGKTLRVPVKAVDPLIDPASGTFNVRIEIPNPDGAIPGGVRCQARFTSTPVATTP